MDAVKAQQPLSPRYPPTAPANASTVSLPRHLTLHPLPAAFNTTRAQRQAGSTGSPSNSQRRTAPLTACCGQTKAQATTRCSGSDTHSAQHVVSVRQEP